MVECIAAIGKSQNGEKHSSSHCSGLKFNQLCGPLWPLVRGNFPTN